MDKLSLKNMANDIKTAMVKNTPGILVGVGIVGMVGTTVLAVKATPKAITLIEAKKRELEVDSLTPVETVKTTWKCYIPATVTGVMSTACLIGASSVSARRNAALATAYNLTKVALNDYKDAVVETIGEKKEQIVRDAVAKKKVERDPVTNTEVIVTERGTTLCYDAVFGRYFRSDIDTIKRAVNELNRSIVSSMYASLNEFYDEIGLPPIDIGDKLGWNLDDGQIEVDFSSQLAVDGTPCLVIQFNVAPDYGYSKFY